MTHLPPRSVPMCYVYPPLLHYKACAKTTKEKVADILLIIFGVLATIYTTFQVGVFGSLHLDSRCSKLNFVPL
jgi:amino acid permease